MNTRDNLDVASNPENIESVLRDRADAFRYNEHMEKAAEMEAKGESLSSSLRMSLGYYKDAKKAATAAGRDVSDPAPAQSGDRLANAYKNLGGNS
ncbi:hypothetical protein [Streptomyces sp. NPDC003660]